MADEFVYFLVGGLAIMAALMVLVGAQFTGYSTATFARLGSPVFVGIAQFDNVDTLYTSFEVNNFLQSDVYNIGDREIKDGLLFGDTSIKLDVGSAQSVMVSFDVVRTNGYGPIVIKLDGNVAAEQNLEEGHYEFALGPAKRVEIAAGNSEWRLWAPALYQLSNVRITANNYPRDISTFTFNLAGVEQIRSARIELNLNSNAGAMIINLNGDVIYDGAVNPVQSIYFNQSKLDSVNILTFEAREDSKFTGRAMLAFTRSSLQSKEFRADLNLTHGEYAKFSSGTLDFEIVDVFRPGGYSVKIVNGNTILLNEYVKLEKGPVEFTLKKQNLRPGLNVIVISPIDDAAFNVQSLITRL